eukprot:6217160-Lingulodinium_polyedra.AAC.1
MRAQMENCRLQTIGLIVENQTPRTRFQEARAEAEVARQRVATILRPEIVQVLLLNVYERMGSLALETNAELASGK